METNKITDHYTSADGIHRIQYHIFYPHNVSPIGIVQIAHGMCDYFERYSEMSEYLVNKGFIVCGNDHLGHGGSVNSNDELGWFAKENGWENAVEDMYTLTKIMKEKYSDIPYFLIGHSMGSFLSRAYTIKHSKSLDGVIFMGTSGGVEILPELLTVVDFMKKINAKVIVKGLRAMSDFEYEFQMALANRRLDGDIETMFLVTSMQNQYVSSSFVKDVARYGASLNGFVPKEIENDIYEKLIK